MNEQELADLKDLEKIVNIELLRADIIANNTVMVTQGKKYAAILKSSAEVLARSKQDMTMRLLYKLGFKNGQPVAINFTTGEVRPVRQEVTQQVNA